MSHLKLRSKNNPGRHVINSIKCHTSKISHFFDHHLQPLVKEISSHIKDNNDFVNKIDNFKVPENSSLVKMDVKALYTSIPNKEGVAAVTRKRGNYTERKTLASKVIAKFLALILTLNSLIFNSKFYLQIKSFVMGTICAHTYPNVFMSDFEERYIYPLIENKSSSYLRFIDDVFMVWTRSENELTTFINEINKKHHSIKFDFKFSKEKIEFLDTFFHKDHNNRL